MDYLKRGWSNTFNSITKNKRLFLVLILLQIIFVVSSSALGAQYLLKILENTQGIIGPLENANYDSQKIEQGEPFTPDYASIYHSYQSMLKNVFSFLAWMTVLCLLLNGSIWLFSHWMFQEQKQWKLRMKAGLQFLVKAWVSAFLLLGSFAIISYFVLLHFVRVSQSFSNIAIVLKSSLVALVVVYYFLVVALAVAPHSSWKKFIFSWIEISIKRFRKTAITFSLSAIALLLSFSVLYGAIEYGESVILLLLSGLFCMMVINLTRIFWIATIQEIEHETSRH